MALGNLISVTFTQQELTDIDAALTVIQNIIQPKSINLTPEERQQYARIRDENENWVIKCRNYMTQFPTVVPNFLDLVEFDADQTPRLQIKSRLGVINSVREMFDDAFLLLGSDVYIGTIIFYRAMKSAADANVPGTTEAYNDLKQQFPGNPGGGPGGPTDPGT